MWFCFAIHHLHSYREAYISENYVSSASNSLILDLLIGIIEGGFHCVLGCTEVVPRWWVLVVTASIDVQGLCHAMVVCIDGVMRW